VVLSTGRKGVLHVPKMTAERWVTQRVSLCSLLSDLGGHEVQKPVTLLQTNSNTSVTFSACITHPFILIILKVSQGIPLVLSLPGPQFQFQGTKIPQAVRHSQMQLPSLGHLKRDDDFSQL